MFPLKSSEIVNESELDILASKLTTHSSFETINLWRSKIKFRKRIKEVKNMAEFRKETITTQGNNVNAPVENEATSYQTIEYLIYFFFGALEILLAFRLILKLTGASVSSGFVGLIYLLTGIFVLPFEGIFRMWFAQGAETTSIFEPSTIVAIIVYAVLALGVVKLIRIFSGKQQQTD
jgi:hypothetical protein